MSKILAELTGAWSTSVLPTQTTLTHIDPTAISGVVETLLSASSAYPHVTKNIDLYHLARAVKGAKASLLVISAQNYIATATATLELPLMTQVIWNATMELQDLEMGFNLYQMDLSYAANAAFAAVFALMLLAHFGISTWKKYLYFGICLVLGTGLEFAGYIGRVMSIGHYSEKTTFLCQIISLTLAPALIMAGVYYLLAQLSVIHGRKFSVLKPLWYSYIFIFCDMSSLAIQAAGGGLAALRLQNLESTTTGTHIMVAGIAFQVLSMTLFVGFLFDFMYRIYFKANPNVRFSFRNLFALFFQTNRGKELRMLYLNQHYNKRYEHIWTRNIFGYYPLALFFSVFFIYVRCVYRLVELSEGWTGYLITHEEYVMTLDGLQVLITCLILVPFHPGLIMGNGANVSLLDISHNADQAYYSDSKLMDTSFSDSTQSYDEKHVGGYRVDSVSSTMTPQGSLPNMLMSPQTFHTGQLFESQPYNAQPYHVPRLAVEPIPEPPRTPVGRMHSRTASEQLMPQQQKEHMDYREHAKRASKDGRINEGGIVAVPYEVTTATPGDSVFSLEKPLPRAKNDRRSRPRRHSRSSSTTRSVNPYERAPTLAELATLGPYEQHYPQRKLFSPKMQHGHDNDDLESQVTHDEFFFSFH